MLAPSVVKVVTDARGDALYFSRAPIPHVRLGASRDPRAAARAVARGLARKHVGLYAYRRDALLRFAVAAAARRSSRPRGSSSCAPSRTACASASCPCEGDAGVAVDTPEDLERVRALLVPEKGRNA